ncbi:MAG: PHP domain-containing protein [Acidaminococcaceae bacterium]
MLVDLHIHSTFSDGFLTPREIVDASKEKNIGVIAITDHDSVNGFIAAREYITTICDGPKIFSGIELGTQIGEKAIHVLGYHFDENYEPLLQRTNELRHAREIRLAQIVDKVKSLGYNIAVEAADASHRAFGRPHVAKALVEKGYFKNIQEAFDILLKRGKPGYVPQPKLSPAEAVDLIHKADGIAFLAHPSELQDLTLVKSLLDTIKFDGIEVWHPSAKSEVLTWRALAKKYKLLMSGGSDFHGDQGRFPYQLGVFPVLYKNVEYVIEYK